MGTDELKRCVLNAESDKGNLECEVNGCFEGLGEDWKPGEHCAWWCQDGRGNGCVISAR